MVRLGSRTPLVKKLLFVEGFSRGGKLFLANVINGFKGVEPIQYYGLLEHIPFLEKFGLIQKKTAEELIRCEIDTHCYEMLIGRNFNHRRHDGTSIYKVPAYKNYLKRSTEKDTDKNLKQFHKNGDYSFFMMHELIPNIKMYFDVFPNLKIISIKRNPAGIVYSWLKRGLLRRLDNDPKIFMIPVLGKNGLVPWYAYSFRDTYHRLSEADRVILSIKKLFQMYKNSYQKLPATAKQKILFISFESFFGNPKKITKNIGKFLQKEVRPEMSSILRKIEMPKDGKHHPACQTKRESLMCYACKLEEIKQAASKKYFDILIKLKYEYETDKTY